MESIQELVEENIKQYLDEVIDAIMILLKASRRKTVSLELMESVAIIIA